MGSKVRCHILPYIAVTVTVLLESIDHRVKDDSVGHIYSYRPLI